MEMNIVEETHEHMSNTSVYGVISRAYSSTAHMRRTLL